MARQYRVIHQRKSLLAALRAGRPYRDWYVAQARGWLMWRTLAICATIAEAEAACRDHAGGTLLPGGRRIISEFERPE